MLLVKKTWTGWRATCQFREVSGNGRSEREALIDFFNSANAMREKLETEMLQAQLNGEYAKASGINEVLGEVNRLFGEIRRRTLNSDE